MMTQTCFMWDSSNYKNKKANQQFYYFLPRDKIDSSRRCTRREELQGEPAVPRLNPPLHLVPQPVSAVGVQHWGRAPGALFGALSAVTDPAGVALRGLPTHVSSLVYHVTCAQGWKLPHKTLDVIKTTSLTSQCSKCAGFSYNHVNRKQFLMHF